MPLFRPHIGKTRVGRVFQLHFPEDEASKPNLKLLAMAKAWKKDKDVITGETEKNQDDLISVQTVNRNVSDSFPLTAI